MPWLGLASNGSVVRLLRPRLPTSSARSGCSHDRGGKHRLGLDVSSCPAYIGQQRIARVSRLGADIPTPIGPAQVFAVTRAYSNLAPPCLTAQPQLILVSSQPQWLRVLVRVVRAALAQEGELARRPADPRTGG